MEPLWVRVCFMEANPSGKGVGLGDHNMGVTEGRNLKWTLRCVFVCLWWVVLIDPWSYERTVPFVMWFVAGSCRLMAHSNGGKNIFFYNFLWTLCIFYLKHFFFFTASYSVLNQFPLPALLSLPFQLNYWPCRFFIVDIGPNQILLSVGLKLHFTFKQGDVHVQSSSFNHLAQFQCGCKLNIKLSIYLTDGFWTAGNMEYDNKCFTVIKGWKEITKRT